MTLASRLVPILAVALLLPATVSAQGKCGFLAGKTPTPWVSVDAGGGIALPIPIASHMKAKSVVPTFGGGVTLHLPRRFAIGVHYRYKEFSESNSTFEYGRFSDLLFKGSLAMVLRQHVQWDLFLLAGPSFVKVRFMDIDPVNPQYVEQNGVVVPVGPIKEKQITAFTAGLGTRFTYFPIDPLGIFVETALHYSLQGSLSGEEGAMNLNVAAGLQGHF